MRFDELKQLLLDNYASQGFTEVTIDGDKIWMLKNPNIEHAYIYLTHKDKLKLELFNVRINFDREKLNDVEIIEDNKEELMVQSVEKPVQPNQKENLEKSLPKIDEAIQDSISTSNSSQKTMLIGIGIFLIIIILLLVSLINKTPEGPRCTTSNGATTCVYPDGRTTTRW